MLIFDALSIYQRVAQPKGFHRIVLRYINRVEIPETTFDFRSTFSTSTHPGKIGAVQ